MPASEEQFIADAYRRAAASRAPLYLRLHNAIAEAMEARVLEPGARLPAEDRLAQYLGLSVGTVRKAMQALTDDGLLERRQGAGTFVAEAGIDMRDVWHFCFVGDDGETFLPLKARAVRVGITRKTGPWAAHMPAAERFVTVRRLVDVAGEFQVLSDFYFDGDRFAGLAERPKADFDRVILRNILTEQYGVRPVRAPQRLRCAALDDRDSRLLKVVPGSPGMILETHGGDARGRPIYYQRVVIPATDRRLAIDR